MRICARDMTLLQLQLSVISDLISRKQKLWSVQLLEQLSGKKFNGICKYFNSIKDKKDLKIKNKYWNFFSQNYYSRQMLRITYCCILNLIHYLYIEITFIISDVLRISWIESKHARTVSDNIMFLVRKTCSSVVYYCFSISRVSATFGIDSIDAVD